METKHKSVTIAMPSTLPTSTTTLSNATRVLPLVRQSTTPPEKAMHRLLTMIVMHHLLARVAATLLAQIAAVMVEATAHLLLALRPSRQPRVAAMVLVKITAATMETVETTMHTAVMAAVATMATAVMAAMAMMTTTTMMMTMMVIMMAMMTIMITAFAPSLLVIRSTSPSSEFLLPPRPYGFTPKTAQSLSHTGGGRETDSIMTGSSKNNSASSSRILTTPVRRMRYRALPPLPRTQKTLPSRTLNVVARIFARISSQRKHRPWTPPELGEWRRLPIGRQPPLGM